MSHRLMANTTGLTAVLVADVAQNVNPITSRRLMGSRSSFSVL